MAACLVGLLNWNSVEEGFVSAAWQVRNDAFAWPRLGLMANFLLLSGGPVLEEWLRARRAAYMGLATIK